MLNIGWPLQHAAMLTASSAVLSAYSCCCAAGRGIVLSSGAQSAFELRGPPDAINLATLFGLNHRQAKVGVQVAYPGL